MLIHIIFWVFNIWCFDFFEEVYHNMLHFRLLVLSWTKRLQIPPFLWKSFLTCTYFFWLWNLLKHQNACCLTRWLFPERPMKNPSANNSKLHSRLVGCMLQYKQMQFPIFYLFFNVNFEIKVLYEILCCCFFFKYKFWINYSRNRINVFCPLHAN